MKTKDLTISELCFGKKAVKSYEPEISKLKILKRFKPTNKLIDLDTYIGIEVEVERIKREGGIGELEVNSADGSAFIWNNTTDGSLRNDGREFVSVPLKGEDISFALSILNDHFKKDKTCIAHEFTDRTSVHIHMNARDLSVEQYNNFLLTYLLVEPLLYKFVGGDRAKNIFCVPVLESDLSGLLGNLADSMVSGTGSNFISNTRAWQKYTGLNLLPTTQYGTIEFRHMTGTSDIDRLSTWINLIFSIKLYALSVKFSDLVSWFSDLNTSSEYLATIHSIFGELTQELDLENVDGFLEHSSCFLKDVIYGRENIRSLQDKTYVIKASDYVKTELIKRASLFRLVEVQNVAKLIADVKKTMASIQSQLETYEKERAKYFELTKTADKQVDVFAKRYVEQFDEVILSEKEKLSKYADKLRELMSSEESPQKSNAEVLNVVDAIVARNQAGIRRQEIAHAWINQGVLPQPDNVARPVNREEDF